LAPATASLQQAAPPALGTDRMFISTTHGAWLPMHVVDRPVCERASMMKITLINLMAIRLPRR
jgi:hypothetical protein